MKVPKHWVLYFVCLPWDLVVAWPAILLIRLFWGKNLRWETPPTGAGGPVLVCELREGSWPARTWYVQRREDGKPFTWGGTTLGHGIFYGVNQLVHGEWTKLQIHEHVHVEQYEGISFGMFVVGSLAGSFVTGLGHLIAGPMLGLTIWTMAYLVMGIGNWSAAWLRGEDLYRGSSHEESAYSQAGEN